MRRRDFITLIGGAASWPLAARAQQGERMRQIGMLMAYAESDSEAQAWIAAFREGLQRLGWTEGRNISLDVRWATGEREAIEHFAKELVARGPELILASTTPATAALLQQTRTIPIVFALVSDPVGSGFVASFPRPGGNVTGFTTMEPTMAGKWLELLKEIAPRVVRVAFLYNPASAPYVDFYLNPFKAAAPSFAVEVIAAPTTTRPSSNPSSPQQRASQMVAFSCGQTRSCPPIARRSHHCWFVIASQRSLRSVFSLKRAL
jgi:putative tryptophan/tyrosine transport system substrate-binding protein